MTFAVENDQTLYLGVDGGGSKCRSSLVSAQNHILGCGLSGPANPVYGLQATLPSIIDTAEQALRDAGLESNDIHNVVAGIALAGVNLPGTFKSVNEWQHPFAEMYLTTDLQAACLGAHGGKDGAVIVTGTGSCAFIQHQGISKTYGGHGFVLGDKGSGAWLGLRALQAVLRAHDNLDEKTALAQYAADLYQAKPLELVEKLSTASPSEFARFAPWVFKAALEKDSVACAIVRDGACYIDKMAKKLLKQKPARFSMIGGIAESLQDWLSSEVLTALSPPLEQPEMGAIYFARNCHLHRQQRIV